MIAEKITLINTVGTSLIEKLKIDPSGTFLDYSYDNSSLNYKDLYNSGIEKLSSKNNKDKYSAEINSILKFKELKSLEIVSLYFLISDTLYGAVSGYILKDYFEKEHNISCNVVRIKNLKSDFIDLKSLLPPIKDILNRYYLPNVYFNITGGYKSVIPYFSVLGMLYKIPTIYIYETSKKIVELSPIPIEFDLTLLDKIMLKLIKIDQETAISEKDFFDGIDYYEREKYKSIIEIENGSVSLSWMGLILWDKYKEDFPITLRRCELSVTDKKIKLADTHHGTEILRKFCSKILNSPFICEIINSIPNNPNFNTFIKKCRDDGKIEFVLDKTDEGYGFIALSTGRNKEETEKIAELIKKRYYS